MPRSAVIAIAVLGVVALLVITTFAFVRSAQLLRARAELAEARGALAELRSEQDGGGAATSDEQDGGATSDEQATSPLDDLLGSDAGEALRDLLSEDAAGLESLLGDGAQQLAGCVQQAGAPGTRDVPDAGTARQVGLIADAVEELRSLRFEREPSPTFVDGDAIGDRVADRIREDYGADDADADSRLLAALGAVPAGTDLIELQSELLAGQVAGFYDPETGELVVRADPAEGSLAPSAQAVVAHELQHALADQAFELPVDTVEDVADGDAALAALSLIEGDATLTQQQFTVVGLSIDEQLGLTVDPDALAAQRQLDDVPHYVARSLEFPYVAGLRFACARYLDGGWQAVDAAYDDLPTTSAEILDPQRYPTPAVDVRDPGDPGGDWQQRRATTIGAADLLWLFEAPGDVTSRALDAPRERALAWTGGELSLWTDGDAIAVGVALAQSADGPLCDALVTWYERAFPDATDAPTRRDERMIREQDGQTAVITCVDADVRLGIGPDLETARAVVR
jgi:hypothetical protein